MKKFISYLMAGLLAIALLCGGALAAEERIIGVQLNGQPLVFSDAVPRVREERTFLPLRPVFEALGAEVIWRAEDPDLIVARRGETTVTMRLGDTQVQVEKDGEIGTIDMDVAPFSAPDLVDGEEVWRTYVPVRFAAEALDVTVGWDQDSYSAVVMDLDALVEQVMAENDFQRLAQVCALSDQYREGIWESTLTGRGGMEVSTEESPLALELALEGKAVTVDGGDFSEELRVTMDLGDLVPQLLEQMIGEEADAMTTLQYNIMVRGLVASLKEEGVTVTVRRSGDAAYFNLTGQLPEMMGLGGEDIWYSVDAGTAGAAGVDVGQLLGAAQGEMDTATLLKSLAGQVEPNHVEAWETLKEALKGLSDEGFVAADPADPSFLVGETFLEGSAGDCSVVVTLELEEDQVAAYVVAIHQSAEETEWTLRQAQDREGTVSTSVEAAMAGQMELWMELEGSYAPGETAPETLPPDGVQIQPLSQIAEKTLKPTTKADVMTLVEDELKAVCWGEYTDDFLSRYSLTAQGADAFRDSVLAAEADYFCDYYDIEYPTDQLLDEIRDLYDVMFRQARFTVLSAEKDAYGDYTVVVELEPVDLLMLVNEDWEAGMGSFFSKYPPDTQSKMSQEAYEAMDREWAGMVLDLLRSKLPQMGHEPAMTFTVEVESDDGALSVDDDDLTEIINWVVQYEG